jgi:hypothetical protein
MLYRLVSASIVVFWVVMTTLLVRNEVNPGASSLREVPVGHVVKQLFIHQQRSNMRIYSGTTPIGHFFMHPKVDPETDMRILDIMCNLVFERDRYQKHRISWETMVQMNSQFEVQESVHKFRTEPSGVAVEIRSSPKNPKMQVRTILDGRVYDREIGLTKAELESVAEDYGIPGEMLSMVQQQKDQAKPTIRARQSFLRLGDQQTETYLVTIENNGQMLLECHFSLLGQAFRANTVFGYTLRDDLLP